MELKSALPRRCAAHLLRNARARPKTGPNGVLWVDLHVAWRRSGCFCRSEVDPHGGSRLSVARIGLWWPMTAATALTARNAPRRARNEAFLEDFGPQRLLSLRLPACSGPYTSSEQPHAVGRLLLACGRCRPFETRLNGTTRSARTSTCSTKSASRPPRLVSNDSVCVRVAAPVASGIALALVGRGAPRRRRKSRPRAPACRRSTAPGRGSLRGRPLRVRAPSVCATQHGVPERRGLGKRAPRHDSRAAHQSAAPKLQVTLQYHMLHFSTKSAPPMTAAARAPAHVVAKRDR